MTPPEKMQLENLGLRDLPNGLLLPSIFTHHTQIFSQTLAPSCKVSFLPKTTLGRAVRRFWGDAIDPQLACHAINTCSFQGRQKNSYFINTVHTFWLMRTSLSVGEVRARNERVTSGVHEMSVQHLVSTFSSFMFGGVTKFMKCVHWQECRICMVLHSRSS